MKAKEFSLLTIADSASNDATTSHAGVVPYHLVKQLRFLGAQNDQEGSKIASHSPSQLEFRVRPTSCRAPHPPLYELPELYRKHIGQIGANLELVLRPHKTPMSSALTNLASKK